MSQVTLKLIALLAMLLDHTAKILLQGGALNAVLGMEMRTLLITAMESAGRMAFPIFAWFAAEGCHRTSDPKKHLLRLLVFAALSEVPFQWSFYPGVGFGCHNVLFTILLASAAIELSKRLETRGAPPALARLLPSAAAIALGWLLKTDYNAWGVALILGLYYLPEEWARLLFLGAWVTVFQLLWHGWNGRTLVWLHAAGRYQLLYWIGALFSLGLLAAYNGRRGRGSRWLFYVFYPCHLALLCCLRAWIP